MNVSPRKRAEWNRWKRSFFPRNPLFNWLQSSRAAAAATKQIRLYRIIGFALNLRRRRDGGGKVFELVDSGAFFLHGISGEKRFFAQRKVEKSFRIRNSSASGNCLLSCWRELIGSSNCFSNWILETDTTFGSWICFFISVWDDLCSTCVELRIVPNFSKVQTQSRQN